MLASFLLLAEGDGAAQAPGGGLMTMLMPLALIMLAFYFLILRPGRRQEADRQTMLGGLKKNDKVVTVGGLIGTVANVKDNDDEVTLKIDDSSNVRVRVLKRSIERVLARTETEQPKE